MRSPSVQATSPRVYCRPPLKVAFHSNQLSRRGTEVALFDYADGNERLLGNESLIFTPLFSKRNDKDAVAKFEKRFTVIRYFGKRSLAKLCQKHGVDVLYAIKGFKDDLYVPGIRNVVHAVFRDCPVHGERFAYVSEWLAQVQSGGRQPFVPHIVTLPRVAGDLRKELGIPVDATVFGRHGGLNTFDVPAAKEAVLEATERRPDLYFLFLNTEVFAPRHPRIIHLPGMSELDYKVRFIQTCDAMLHARAEGETFGIAVGEFSILNKPVFTWADAFDQCHLDILGDKAQIFKEKSDLLQMLLEFDRIEAQKKDWDAYSKRFAPEPVMRKFQEVFLSGDLR